MECFTMLHTMGMLKIVYVADKYPSNAIALEIYLLQKIEHTVAFRLKVLCIAQQESTGKPLFYVMLTLLCKNSILGLKYIANKQQCNKCFVCT